VSRGESSAPGPIRLDTSARRAADLVFGTLLLLAASPVLLLAALAVRLDSPGPVLFVQSRVGRHGKPFPILKFRSMVRDAERIGPRISGRHDPRITRVGRMLRATKVDELPQILNVLRGEMTLIGPRAEVMEAVAHYSTEELRLLEVRPGLTGPGQIHFTTDQAAALDGAEDAEAFYRDHLLHAKLALDLDYLRHRSVGRDLSLIGRTALVILGWRR
jgi:lipopolysaccharide/colanic/teichoic acid biosynthesis glycosyltransferase